MYMDKWEKEFCEVKKKLEKAILEEDEEEDEEEGLCMYCYTRNGMFVVCKSCGYGLCPPCIRNRNLGSHCAQCNSEEFELVNSYEDDWGTVHYYDHQRRVYYRRM